MPRILRSNSKIFVPHVYSIKRDNVIEATRGNCVSSASTLDTMLGIDYNSDSDSDSEQRQPSSPKLLASSTIRKPSNGGLSLPAPKLTSSENGKKPGAPKPKKIVVALPKLEKRASDDEDEDEKPATKRPKLGGSGGSSSLFSMLPAPKKSGLSLPPPQRVLGGGKSGVAFAGTGTSNKAAAADDGPPVDDDEVEAGPAPPQTATSLIPPSLLLKGKGKAKAKPPTTPISAAPAIDFFSLGEYRCRDKTIF